MAKFGLDKYYTPVETANACIDIVLDAIGLDNITEAIEPSIGGGAFTHHPVLRPVLGIDVAPEVEGDGTMSVVKANYLTYPIPYRKGRLVIGNPPFGERMNLAQKFFRKSTEIADHIAFILPISQLDNTSSMKGFNLVRSVDLGVLDYSGRALRCCFNVYTRPKNGEMSDRRRTTDAITIKRQDASDYDTAPFDIRMCYWGNGSMGRILEDGEHYSAEYKILVKDIPRRDEIIDFIRSHDWRSATNNISMKKLHQFHIVDALLDRFPELERREPEQNPLW